MQTGKSKNDLMGIEGGEEREEGRGEPKQGFNKIYDLFHSCKDIETSRVFCEMLGFTQCGGDQSQGWL
jgi:hypothetical protein